MSDDEDLGEKTVIMAPGAARKLATAPKARLKCGDTSLLGIGPGAEILLVESEVTVGRSADNTIALQADGISRKHARLYPSGQGWRIEDLGSTNGVRVNGQKTDKADLKHGDKVDIGKVPYSFSVDGEGPATGESEQVYATRATAPKPAASAKPAPAAAKPAAAPKPAAAKPAAPRAAKPAAKSGGSNALLWIIVLVGAAVLGFVAYSVLT